MYDGILVSIKCLVYNHAPFLRDCLDGFIMQKTDFRFEVIIHDDASTDESADIIREYVRQYPDIIKPIFQHENQYSKGNGAGIRQIIEDNITSTSKYIAFCEGDDYWTDPYKLQKQVDFLETHPEYVLCSHRYQLYYQTEKKFGRILPDTAVDSLSYDLQSYITGIWVTQPLSCVYLRSALDFNLYNKCKYAKDLVLYYLILQSGKGFMFKDAMGVYRIHANGIWSGVGVQQQIISDLKALCGLYELVASRNIALKIRNFMQEKCAYFGCNFIYKNFGLLLVCWKIVRQHFGIKEAFFLFFHELHLKSKVLFFK